MVAKKILSQSQRFKFFFHVPRDELQQFFCLVSSDDKTFLINPDRETQLKFIR